MGKQYVQDLEKQRRDEEKAAEEAAARRAEQAARAEERRRVQVSRASTPDTCMSAATGHVALPSVTLQVEGHPPCTASYLLHAMLCVPGLLLPAIALCTC
jgi:hypothetical protein